MSDTLYTCPWPPRGSVIHKLARHCVGNTAPRHILNLREFASEHGLTHAQLVWKAVRLRSKYHYYICPVKGENQRPFLFEAVPDWPTYSVRVVGGERVEVVHADPRLSAPAPVLRRWRGNPLPGTPLHRVWTYLKNHRVHGVVDVHDFAKTFPGGIARVHLNFAKLRRYYGYDIEPETPGAHDCRFRVTKLPNPPLSPEQYEAIRATRFARRPRKGPCLTARTAAPKLPRPAQVSDPGDDFDAPSEPILDTCT